MRYTTTIAGTGTNTTGIPVPDEVVDELGGGRRAPVRITVRGHSYRASIGTVDGRSMVSLSAENRSAAGVAAGEEVEVQIELDTQPREVDVPSDFAAALDAEPAARRFFDGLPYSQRRWFVMGIDDAKTPETRGRRIEKAVERLREGRGQR